MKNHKERNYILKCKRDGNVLTLIHGKYNLFYRCPLYYRENRIKDTSPCTLYISMLEKEQLLGELHVLDVTDGIKEGSKGATHNIEFEVGKVYDEYTEVLIDRIKENDK